MSPLKKTTPITTAMVLAAGYGTRMRPLTDHCSKAMVELDGKPLIDHMLERLEAAGLKRVVVNVHAHADQLEAHLRARKSGLDILISDERELLLETGGGMVKALPLLGDGPVLACNIDAVWAEFGQPAISMLIERWDETRMEDLLLLAPMAQSLGYHGQGDFLFSHDGRLERRGARDHAPYVYAGVQITKLSRLAKQPIEPFSRNRIWDMTLEAGTIYGAVLDGFWMHVGDPTARDGAQKRIDIMRDTTGL